MKKRTGTVSVFLVGALFVALLLAPRLSAEVDDEVQTMLVLGREATAARSTDADGGAVTTRQAADMGLVDDEFLRIDATLRISIPYGFQSPLPLVDEGTAVVASGHGGCTEDELVTVAVTITQSTSGAVATGQTEQTCSGELQHWSLTATVDTPPAFTEGAAQACGLATTYAAGYVTDTYDWCVDVEVALLDHQVFLPLAVRQ